MLSNSKSFSQNDMIIADDSLVCFPMRYLTFIKQDLIKGDQNEKKVEELNESMSFQQNENKSLKQKLQMQLDECSTCRDSLEMKNSLIINYHGQINRAKKKNTIYTALIVVLTGLFFIK
jgi:hypothetical protein